MALLDLFRRRPPETRSVPVAWINPSTLSFNLDPNRSGLAVATKPGLATGVPAVYAAVSMIARAVSVLPWESMNRNTGERVEPQPTIVRRPNPDTSIGDTREELLVSMLLWGEAFMYLDQPVNGRPTVAIPIPNSAVRISWNKNQTRRRYWIGDDELILNKEIAHIPLLRYPGWKHGLGPIQAARVSVSGSLEAEGMAADQFGTGGPPVDGVVTVPGKLTKPEADLHREQWQESAGGRGPAFLSGGMGFQTTNMSNVDLQFLESRNYGVLDIARLFNIPPTFLAAELQGSSITYSNQEQAYVNLMRQAYQPVADKLETAFEQWIPATQVLRTDFRALLRGDIRTRFDTYEIGTRIGILTPNEIRKAENLEPLAGGDAPIVQDETISTETTEVTT